MSYQSRSSRIKSLARHDDSIYRSTIDSFSNVTDATRSSSRQSIRAHSRNYIDPWDLENYAYIQRYDIILYLAYKTEKWFWFLDFLREKISLKHMNLSICYRIWLDSLHFSNNFELVNIMNKLHLSRGTVEEHLFEVPDHIVRMLWRQVVVF